MCPLLRGFTVQFSHHCLSVRKLVRVPKRSHQEDEVVTFWGEEKPLQIAEKEQVSTEQACFHSLSSTTPSLLTSQWQRRWAKVRAAFSSDPHTDTQPTTPQLTTVEHMWKKWGGGRKKGKKGEIKKKKWRRKKSDCPAMSQLSWPPSQHNIVGLAGQLSRRTAIHIRFIKLMSHNGCSIITAGVNTNF